MSRKPFGKIQNVKLKQGNEGGSKPGGTRRKGSICTPYLDASMLDPSIQRTSFDGLNVDPTRIIASMGIYIPVYDNRKRKQESIKERLAETTQRLNKTIIAYDTLNDYEKETKKREQTLKNTRGKLQMMEDGEMKETLSSLLSQQNKVSENTIGALSQRDEWFSADHTELDTLQVSINEEEEDEIEKNYTSTLTNFEKLKRVQHQLRLRKLDPKKLLALQKEKKMLETEVMNSVKEMESISIQAAPSSDGEPPPWKNAADQIVNLLNRVRVEGGQEMLKMSSHLTELLKNLDQQQKQIKNIFKRDKTDLIFCSLQGELRREKKVATQLTDEVTNLKSDVIDLQEKVIGLQLELDRTKKDLEHTLSEKANAMSLIKKSQQAQRKTKVKKRPSAIPEDGFKLRLTLSGLMDEFLHDEVPVHKSISDHVLLNSSLKEHKEGIHLLVHEVERLNNFNLDMEKEMNEQEDRIKELQDRIEDLLDTPSDEDESGRLCDNCKRRGEVSVLSTKTPMGNEEVNSMKEKLKYFQKCLADTELKLSDAYKEISDLRMQFAYGSEQRLSSPPPTPSDKGEEQTPDEEELPELGAGLQTDKDQQKGFRKGRKIKKSGGKKKVLKLPPLRTGSILGVDPTMMDELPDELLMPEAQTEREEKLWKLGDLQGRMSQLMTEILQFVKSVANMIGPDQEGYPLIGPDQETAAPKINALQHYEFDAKMPMKAGKQDKPNITENQLRNSEVFFHGQKAVKCLKDAYELLSSTLNLQHDDYELIYRAFKNHQFLRSIMRAVIAGKLPLSALEEARRGRCANIDVGKAATQHGVKSNRKSEGLVRDKGIWRSVSASSISSDRLESNPKEKGPCEPLVLKRLSVKVLHPIEGL